MSTMNEDRFLRLRDVMRMTGLSKASIYAFVKKGEFPRQVKLSDEGRSCAWLLSDISKWMQSRIEASRGAA